MFNDFWKKLHSPALSQGQRPLLSLQEIALRQKQGLLLPLAEQEPPHEFIARLQIEAMALGYIFTPEAAKALAQQEDIVPQVFQVLKKLKGADKVWKPIYPNFPEQVFEMDQLSLFVNALGHYATSGQWRPEYKSKKRLPFDEHTSFQRLGRLDPEDIGAVLTQLLSANASLSSLHKDMLWAFLNHFDPSFLAVYLPLEIPFKETLCQWVADCVEKDCEELASYGVQTATDVLRVATHFSGGDISLAENTRFKLSRPQRRWVVAQLERVITASDLARHRKKWKRLFHTLHIGSFKNNPKTQTLARAIRQGKLPTERTHIEQALVHRELNRLLTLFRSHPGEFARRMDHLLRIFPKDHDRILSEFKAAMSQINTRVLLQLWGHMRFRHTHGQGKAGKPHDITRVVMPKGQMAKVQLLTTTLPAIELSTLSKLILAIETLLMKRFSALPPLGKTWIDPALKKAPIPLQMRNAAEGLCLMQRGSRLALPSEKNILRFFVHWVGMDIDLSACFLTSDLKLHSAITYYNLKETKNLRAAHSGDITYAPPPDGACEFIDIDLNSVRDPQIQYIALDVRVYEGPPFVSQQANVGWMFREELGQKGEVFEARAVEQRVAMGTNGYSAMVALFDIHQKEVIWTDLKGQASRLQGGNNVASNHTNLETLLKTTLHFHTLSLYELLTLHAKSRGEEVNQKAEAETVFDTSLIFDTVRVMSDFMS